MPARSVWVCCFACSYLLLPVVYRVRFGRWPYAYDVHRRDFYTGVDLAYGGALVAYTVALLFGPSPNPVTTIGGLAATGAGLSLQVWAVPAMRKNWRFGQDPRDENVEYVSCGPFRWLEHPIYVGLLVLAVGQGLVVGIDRRTVLLLAAPLAHYVLQKRCETRHWAARRPRAS